MIMYCEYLDKSLNDYQADLFPITVACHFNKKRLIKALTSLGISNWKKFLKEDYNSDDTECVISIFDDHGWKYKRQVLD